MMYTLTLSHSTDRDSSMIDRRDRLFICRQELARSASIQMKESQRLVASIVPECRRLLRALRHRCRNTIPSVPSQVSRGGFFVRRSRLTYWARSYRTLMVYISFDVSSLICTFNSWVYCALRHIYGFRLSRWAPWFFFEFAWAFLFTFLALSFKLFVCVVINHQKRGDCKHLGPLGMFRWLMTTVIMTNEFVQLNESLSLIWSFVKEAPHFRYSKRRSRYSTQIYNKTKDLSSPKCHKIEKDT